MKEEPELERQGTDGPGRAGASLASVKSGPGRTRIGLSGVAVMAGAALLSKIIGVFQKIPLQNMAGDRVFGIYNAVYPFYQLIAVLATAGLPTAVSLLIAERLRKGSDPEGVRRILYAAILLLGVTGIAAFGWMWAAADGVARLIGDSGTAGAIRAVSFALLAAPFAAALRGYAQGTGRMALSAGSQLTEQLVRVAVMLAVVVASWSAGWNEASVAAGVMSGSAAGAFSALLMLIVCLWRQREGRFSRHGGGGSGKITAFRQASAPQRKLLAEMKKLAVLALPAALGAVVVPVLGVVDAFTVPRLLREGGLPEPEAMALFGVYSRAQPLVQLVVMVAGAGAAALVPGLALARMRGAYGQLRLQLALTERAAWAAGAAASVGLVLLARPLNVMFYADDRGTALFALIGCTALAGCVNAVNAPVLQALGSARAPIQLVLLAAGLKGICNAVLVPLYGADGAAAAGIAALTAAAMLGTAAVRRAAAASGAALGGRTVPGKRSGSAGGRTAAEAEATSDAAQRGMLQAEREGAEALRHTARASGAVTGNAAGKIGAKPVRLASAGSEVIPGMKAAGKGDDANVPAQPGAANVADATAGGASGTGRRPWPADRRAAAACGFALAVMAAALLVAERALDAALGGVLPPRAAAAALALTGAAVGASAFGAAALRGGAVSAREWRALPGGGVLAARLRRWRLLPPAEGER
ncbi:oligosaccharide flippase family protein [Paenibacillus vietnamensis]|uniref:oligosaccharide flippase family protein n=1 Tax=Paenibacillus vietnamensis TaxID=2590547 RepID=UPI001CD14721|nr:oligosaccharide flippase family protein [Paenibacillus vietnamensis]